MTASAELAETDYLALAFGSPESQPSASCTFIAKPVHTKHLATICSRKSQAVSLLYLLTSESNQVKVAFNFHKNVPAHGAEKKKKITI